jgi:hypothetical protein
MLFHLSAATVFLVILFCKSITHQHSTSKSTNHSPEHINHLPHPHPARKVAMATAMANPSPLGRGLTPPVIAYNRHRLLPILAPILPSALTSRLAHYTPLSTFSFSDQVAAGLSSGNFDVERDNLGGPSGGSRDSRMGMDEAGVEEVRRIM